MDSQVKKNLGPLCALIGVWQGDKGLDRAPEPEGMSDNPYRETLTITLVGDVTNAERQVLWVARYHQTVAKLADGQVFHDETGYYIWDAAASLVVQSLAIPRAVTLLAGGTIQNADFSENETRLKLEAREGGEFGIIQSPFMRTNARTTRFTHEISVTGNTLRYRETTYVDIYGRAVEHTDANDLIRVG